MTDRNSKPKPDERVRYEVYGMPIDGIIEGAMAPEREAAAKAAQADTERQKPEQPAWPTLEELQAQGPRATPRRRP